MTPRVLTVPGTRRHRPIEHEPAMVTGTEVDRIEVSRTLARLGVRALDVRLYGSGADRTLQGTIDNMQRFADRVIAKVQG